MMKKKIFFMLFFCFHTFLWAETNSLAYYDLAKIKDTFPTSQVHRKASKYDVITVENSLQGYTLILYAYPSKDFAKKMYYDTLQTAARQNLLAFLSDTGYTTLLDTEAGIVYGFFVEEGEFISVRFTNLEVIPDILNIISEKLGSWKKI